MSEFLQHVINGLSLGSTYALIALGYTMVFGILKLINFAHGDVYMLGAFFGMYSARFFSFGQNPSLIALLVTILIAMLCCALIGFLIEFLAYRPLRSAPRINLLITAVGVSLLLEFGGQIVFGSDPKFFPQVYRPQTEWAMGDVKIYPLQVINFAIALVLMIILQYIVFRTRLGRAMRAVSFNHELAGLMGIPTNRIISMTFVIGSALAGAAGVLIALSYPRIDPLMGVMPGLKAFSAAVLGGIGNLYGAVAGALILGLSEQLVVAYVAPTLRDAIAFIILIGILLFKPSGIFGVHTVEKV
jgi:branched-chain amino acid transport system permease protein